MSSAKIIDEMQYGYWYGRAEAEEEEALYLAQINAWIDECVGNESENYNAAWNDTQHAINRRRCRVRQGKALAEWNREHRFNRA